MNERDTTHGMGRTGSKTTTDERGRSDTTTTTSSGSTLLEVSKSETIADRADINRINKELPDDWTVKPDIVQSEAEPLAETLLFRRSLSDPQIVLRPEDPAVPNKNIELYERSGPKTTSKQIGTVDQLSEAVRVAVNRVHQLNT